MIRDLFKKKENNDNNLNFDALVEKVKKMPAPDGQTLLWKETFHLEKWHFITKPLSERNEPKPFIGEVDGKGWMYIFTDGLHARKFGEAQGLVNANGSIHTIAMEPKKAVEWLYGWGELGVYGLRFNEGEFGWFAPIGNLRPMMEYLKI
jgi:hypothetical protein